MAVFWNWTTATHEGGTEQRIKETFNWYHKEAVKHRGNWKTRVLFTFFSIVIEYL